MASSLPDSPLCLNCGAGMGGARYCGECGQERVGRLLSTRELVHQYVEDTFSLDNRLLRTLRPLLIQPGLLTVEYLVGRRRRYIQPLRLYLLASVGFFAAFSLRYDPQAVVRAADVDVAAKAAADSSGLRSDGSVQRLADGSLHVQLDDDASANIDLDLLGKLSFLPIIGPRLAARKAELETMNPGELLRQGLAEAMHHAPKGIFLLAPMIALVLKLLYWRRSRHYLEHFIFALHWHSWIFGVLLVILWNPWTPADVALVLLAPLYLLLALRKVYRQSWLRTLCKQQIVLWTYLPGLAITFGFLTILSALTI